MIFHSYDFIFFRMVFFGLRQGLRPIYIYIYIYIYMLFQDGLRRGLRRGFVFMRLFNFPGPCCPVCLRDSPELFEDVEVHVFNMYVLFDRSPRGQGSFWASCWGSQGGSKTVSGSFYAHHVLRTYGYVFRTYVLKGLIKNNKKNAPRRGPQGFRHKR